MNRDNSGIQNRHLAKTNVGRHYAGLEHSRTDKAYKEFKRVPDYKMKRVSAIEYLKEKEGVADE